MNTGAKASRGRDAAILAAVALACLLPFLGKAFHVDDPMYIWAAEQVVADPANFYGFDVNWHAFFEPNWVANKNPPLIAFWLAGVSRVVGWSEPALHLAMLVPLGALLLGVYALGRRLTSSPLAVGLVLLSLPVVLVSSSTVMSDVLMLSLWCGAVWFWMRGVDDARPGLLVAAGVLMGLAPLAKYFGVALIPLLSAWALARRAPTRLWLPPLAIPVAMIGGYDLRSFVPTASRPTAAGWRLLIRRGLSASVARRDRHGISSSNYASAGNAGPLSRLTWQSAGKA